MPENIINDLSGKFIGTVISVNRANRTIEAYIPKLMPAIQENQKDLLTLTNKGNSTISIPYKNNIKLSSTMTIHARNASTPMPTNGSRVLIWFIDDNPELGVWEEFNYNGDYDEILEEKYPEQAELTIGDKRIVINKNDIIEISLPETYDVMQLNNGKTKIFKIQENKESSDNLNYVIRAIGNKTITRTETDSSGNEISKVIPSSGIYRDIEDINNQITNTNNNILDLDSKIRAAAKSQNFTATVLKYSDLSGLDTSNYDFNDCVLVLQDETHDKKSGVYKWTKKVDENDSGKVITEFEYVGELGSYYTKREVNNLIPYPNANDIPAETRSSYLYNLCMRDPNGNIVYKFLPKVSSFTCVLTLGRAESGVTADKTKSDVDSGILNTFEQNIKQIEFDIPVSTWDENTENLYESINSFTYDSSGSTEALNWLCEYLNNNLNSYALSKSTDKINCHAAIISIPIFDETVGNKILTAVAFVNKSGHYYLMTDFRDLSTYALGGYIFWEIKSIKLY